MQGNKYDKKIFLFTTNKFKNVGGNIKVITGMKRCGESILLFDFFNSFLINGGGKEECIIKIELDKRKYLEFIVLWL